MKSKDIQLRGGHTLKYIGGALWEFVPAYPDCRVYLTFNDKGTDIITLDADSMGMPLMVGCTVCDYKVSGIHNIDGAYMVCMLPLMKDKAIDLTKGDEIYIADMNEYTVNKYVIKDVDVKSEVILLTFAEKTPSDEYIALPKEHEGSLRTGVYIFFGVGKIAFTDDKNAKKYVYDTIQDKINNLRKKQKALYND